MMGTEGDLLTAGQLAAVARVRTVCTGAGIAGALVSMAANMLASDGSAVGLAVGAIAPGAFIVAAEIASTASSLPRTTGTRSLLATLIALLVIIGGAAAVVSFGHLRVVVDSVGESTTAEILIAIVVDAVAVMGLVGHRLTSLYVRRHQMATEAKREAERTAAAEAANEASHKSAAAAARARRLAKRSAPTNPGGAADPTSATPQLIIEGDDPSLPPSQRARAIAAANPGLTQAEIARLIGRGERTVRRYLAQPSAAAEPTDEQPRAKHTTKAQGPEGPGLVAVG